VKFKFFSVAGMILPLGFPYYLGKLQNRNFQVYHLSNASCIVAFFIFKEKGNKNLHFKEKSNGDLPPFLSIV